MDRTRDHLALELIRFHDRQVSGGQVIAAQGRRLHPGNGEVLMRIRFRGAVGQGTDERNHLDDDGLIVMQKDRQRARETDFAAEFLADFPHDGRRRILTGFDLAAGKLPFQRQVLVRRTLGEQQAARSFDQGTDNGNGSGGGHARVLNKELDRAATFLGAVCLWGMNTSLRIFLIVVLALLALKFLPVILIGAFVGLLLAAGLGALGLTLVALLLAVGIALALALSPIWIPVLIVMGLISLFKKLGEKPAPPVMAA